MRALWVSVQGAAWVRALSLSIAPLGTLRLTFRINAPSRGPVYIQRCDHQAPAQGLWRNQGREGGRDHDNDGPGKCAVVQFKF